MGMMEDNLPIDDLVRAAYPGVELKRSAGANKTPTMFGYFAVFNQWAEIDSVYEGHFLERFAPGCFSKTIRENRDRIQVLFDHGEDPYIGKKPLGRIIDLREDSDKGAYYEVELLNASYIQDLLEGLRAGLYGSSFKFGVVKADVIMRPKPSAYNPLGLPERTVTEARIKEFGPVPFPVYAGSTSGVRSMTDQFRHDQRTTSDDNDTLYKRSMELVGEKPWAIHPAMMETMIGIMAERKLGYKPSPEEIKERIGTRSVAAEPAADGPVAVINVTGTIMPHATLMSDISGGGSIENLQNELRAALADPNIKAIMLNIDSPGGAVSMVPEFAAELLAARDIKPIHAVANTDAFSAAYWIASAATDISVTPSGAVGSVGVITAHQDVSSMLEKQGVKPTLITAGKYKGELSPFQPLTEEAQARLQQEVDSYYQMFVDAIAKGRGTTTQDVIDNYGQGRTVLAKDAVKAGMADRIESFDQAYARLQKKYTPRSTATPMAATSNSAYAIDLTNGTVDFQKWMDPEWAQVTGTNDRINIIFTNPPTVTAGYVDDVVDIEATAVPYKKTDVVDEPWDGPAQEAKLSSPITKSSGFAMYAWYDKNGNDPDGDGYPDAKADWKFPHHMVDNGKPGVANVNGVRNALARLTNANIPSSEKAGVRSHLESHLNDFNNAEEQKEPQGPEEPDTLEENALVGNGAGNAHSSATSREVVEFTHNTIVSEEKNRMANSGMTIEEVKARLDEIKARQKEIVAAFGTDPFTDEVRAEWDAMIPEREDLLARVKDYEVRQSVLRQYNLDDDDRHKELVEYAHSQAPSQIRRAKASRIPDNIFAVEDYRNLSRNADELREAYRDGAMRAIEVSHFPHPEANREDVQGHVARLLDTVDDENGTLARRILTTGSPTYQRAFTKYIGGSGLTAEEQRSLSLTGSAGGYAVPVVVDPTVILTSNGVLNPVRQLARVQTIVGNEWHGVSSAGITAAYAAEATEASDNAPSFSQPIANVEKAQAFIPFSIEIGEDWGALQSEMALMLQDAKDTLESNKFLTGLGHTSNVPEGLLVGATAVVSTAATATFAVADVYSLETGLAPRWRPRAAIVANRAIYNKVRQFDTAGGASLWVQLQNDLPARLIGYPSYEWSDYTSATTTGSSIMTIGDFSQFLILDRVGMNIELIPLMLNTGNNRPDGTRGLYAYWRNTSKVLTNAAFKTLKVL